jgi:hypothetical protein
MEGAMADRLYLTLVLRGYNGNNMLRHYERMLRVFPFSRLSGAASVLRVNAVSETEPPLFERLFEDPPDVGAVLEAAKQFTTADCAVQFDSRWDLWQYEGDWKLTPSGVTLACLGPEFESDDGAHLRIDLGIDAPFLPQHDLPNHLFMARSNIRSLLHLVGELDRTLTVESRRLWSESGENFAERLQASLADE